MRCCRRTRTAGNLRPVEFLLTHSQQSLNHSSSKQVDPPICLCPFVSHRQRYPQCSILHMPPKQARQTRAMHHARRIKNHAISRPLPFHAINPSPFQSSMSLYWYVQRKEDMSHSLTFDQSIHVFSSTAHFASSFAATGRNPNIPGFSGGFLNLPNPKSRSRIIFRALRLRKNGSGDFAS